MTPCSIGAAPPSRVGGARYDGAVCLALTLLVLMVPRSVLAQPTTVAGIVVDSAGQGIADVHVWVDNSPGSSATNISGRFFLRSVSPGTTILRARRLGFRPVVMELDIPPDGARELTLRMTPVATPLEPVAVRASAAGFTGRLAGYYERLSARGGGVFITRSQIDREGSRQLTYLLTHVPGITAQRMRGGGSGVRLRGRTCWPLVYLDGMAMPAGEVDLDAISPTSLHGIELYLGATSTPLRFQQARGMASCGTILLWSRGPDTDPVGRSLHSSAYLEQLVASASVFSADQVDQPATLDRARSGGPQFPPSLMAEGAYGTVVAEYIVDAHGRVEDGTFGIVSSTHPLFSEAVRQASRQLRYLPAVRAGVAVRQLVQQPFSFTSAARAGEPRPAQGTSP